jgi:hypothetical protein
MHLRPELAEVVTALLRAHPANATIPLDAVGDALGVRAVSTEEIDVIFKQLEHAGRRVVAPAGGSGEAHLKRVIEAARTLKQGDRSRRPALRDVATLARLSPSEVLNALYLLRIMQR